MDSPLSFPADVRFRADKTIRAVGVLTFICPIPGGDVV